MFDRLFFTGHLEEDETIILITHRHWLMGSRALALPILSTLAAAGALIATAHGKLAIIVLLAWFGASVLWALRNFFDYYLDAWIITNHGIIDLEWHGWFHRQSSRILYSDIQGVSTEIQGIAATVLRFGTISVEKISTGAAISLSEVPKPRAVESVILRCMEQYLHSKNLKNAKSN
jgi:hypothetical protein